MDFGDDTLDPSNLIAQIPGDTLHFGRSSDGITFTLGFLGACECCGERTMGVVICDYCNEEFPVKTDDFAEKLLMIVSSHQCA